MSLRHRWLAVSLVFTVIIFPFQSAVCSEESGTVGLRELIVLALRNDPGLVALRNQIPVEEARKRAATQWRDPEVRVGYSKDDNLRIDPSGNGNNGGGGDRSNSFRVRFFVPKPWEMKAMVNQAAREVDLASFQVTAAEREVILEVREQYEELQFLFKRLQGSRRQIEIIEEHASNEQALLDAGGAFTLDQLSFEDIKIPGIQMAIDAAETELDAAKRSLAARVGLADGSRIRVTDPLLRSGIDLQDTDLDYLTLMAFAHRGEVGILKHEQAIAEAELGLVKSKQIPWFTFIEPEYAQDYTGGNLSDEAYGVRVAVILPLFSWLAREEKVVEERISGYYASLEANQKNIANEVAEAFQSVKEAMKYQARTQAAVAKHSMMMKEKAKGLDASEDLAARERLRYDTEMERSKIHEYKLSSERLFNQSLLRLERALGADLDRVLRVEYEALDTAGDSAVVPSEMGAAGPSPTSQGLRAVRAAPVPEANVRKSKTEGEAPKRKGLFHFLKEQGNAR